MYCSNCGSALPQGQSYCNHCGTELVTKKDLAATRSGPNPGMLVPAIAFVTVFGLAATACLAVVTQEVSGFQASWILAIVFLGFLLILATDVFFAYLLLRSKRPNQEKYLKELITAELSQRAVAALPQPEFSVTDQTTRHLERVERDGES